VRSADLIGREEQATLFPSADGLIRQKKRETDMNNIFYIIGVVVVVLFVLGYFGLR
jgi:hypothetical protein